MKMENQIQSIGQILTNRTSPDRKQSQPAKMKCECGQPVEETILFGRTLTNKLCPVCADRIRIEESAKAIRYSHKEKYESLRTALNKTIPPLFARAHLRDFNQRFKIELLDYEKNVGSIIYGTVGRGKSHALAALARYFILKHKRVMRITYEMLCLQIRDTYKPGSKKTEMDIIKPLIECDYLMLEDIGSATSIGKDETDFSNRTIFILLDQRIEACRPTFITTNKTRENLSNSFDARIASRLNLFKWLQAGGQDKRNINNQNKERI